MKTAFTPTRAQRALLGSCRPGALHPVAGDGDTAGQGGVITILVPTTRRTMTDQIRKSTPRHAHVHAHACIRSLPLAAHLRSRQDLTPIFPLDRCVGLHDALQLLGEVVNKSGGTHAAQMICQGIRHSGQVDEYPWFKRGFAISPSDLSRNPRS